MAPKNLEERLREYGMLDRIERLVAVVEDAAGDVEKADEAERRVIEELRQMGSEALHAWAARKADQKADEVRKTGGAQGHGKKNLVAHDLRNSYSAGTAIPSFGICSETVQLVRRGHSPRLFDAFAACHGGLWS